MNKTQNNSHQILPHSKSGASESTSATEPVGQSGSHYESLSFPWQKIHSFVILGAER